MVLLATAEMMASWQETKRLLVEGKALLSVSVAAQHAADLEQFDEFIDHNELGLAFQWLESIAWDRQRNCLPLLNLLKLAAKQMKMDDATAFLEEEIASLQAQP